MRESMRAKRTAALTPTIDPDLLDAFIERIAVLMVGIEEECLRLGLPLEHISIARGKAPSKGPRIGDSDGDGVRLNS